MFWLQTIRELRRRGVIGINRRNLDWIARGNPRELIALVDDKLELSRLCERLQVPVPHTYLVAQTPQQLPATLELLNELGECVVKPVRGAGGRGVLVLTRNAGAGFVRPNGQPMTPEAVRHHLGEILAGVYSLGGTGDRIMVQERVRVHPDLARISFRGLPDIRVVVRDARPALAMLRLATLESNGRANLHQGGVGVGIDLHAGVTTSAIHHHGWISEHPDTGEPLAGRPIPHWEEILEISSRVARALGMGYLGMDLVLDSRRGPLLLEANARPGLAIQLACRQGLAGGDSAGV